MLRGPVEGENTFPLTVANDFKKVLPSQKGENNYNLFYFICVLQTLLLTIEARLYLIFHAVVKSGLSNRRVQVMSTKAKGHTNIN